MLLPAETNAGTLRSSNAAFVSAAAPVATYERVATFERLSRAADPARADNRIAERLRRVLNVTIAVALLIVTLPLTIIIGLLIKLTSPGPILYTQARVGVDRRHWGDGVPDGRRVVDYGGRLFRIYKFRTMYVSPSDAPQTWAKRDDPRVTPVGRFLRKYRLDELPQLYNVVRGDMNFVGPRPEQPRIFALLRDQIPNYELRQRVLPGITGLAQVNLAYDTSMDDVRNKVRYDLEYIERRSPIQDVRIMLRTFPAVIRKRGW
jgi:lipopolysaccharide/colanic/teichoic acid biosynthesis glycosyltransferase